MNEMHLLCLRDWEFLFFVTDNILVLFGSWDWESNSYDLLGVSSLNLIIVAIC